MHLFYFHITYLS